MGTKKPRSLTTSGFFGVASIKDAQYGCGEGIWTSWPSGYEPDELPDCSIPRYCGAGSRGRTGTRNKSHGILSPGRLPIPPFRQDTTLDFLSAFLLYHHFPKKSIPFSKKLKNNIDNTFFLWYYIRARVWRPLFYYMQYVIFLLQESLTRLRGVCEADSENHQNRHI